MHTTAVVSPPRLARGRSADYRSSIALKGRLVLRPGGRPRLGPHPARSRASAAQARTYCVDPGQAGGLQLAPPSSSLRAAASLPHLCVQPPAATMAWPRLAAPLRPVPTPPSRRGTGATAPVTPTSAVIAPVGPGSYHVCHGCCFPAALARGAPPTTAQASRRGAAKSCDRAPGPGRVPPGPLPILCGSGLRLLGYCSAQAESVPSVRRRTS